MSGGSPVVRSPAMVSARHPNDLDVTSFLPVLTTEYADIMDESKYFCINSLKFPALSDKKGPTAVIFYLKYEGRLLVILEICLFSLATVQFSADK